MNFKSLKIEHEILIFIFLLYYSNPKIKFIYTKGEEFVTESVPCHLNRY